MILPISVFQWGYKCSFFVISKRPRTLVIQAKKLVNPSGTEEEMMKKEIKFISDELPNLNIQIPGYTYSGAVLWSWSRFHQAFVIRWTN